MKMEQRSIDFIPAEERHGSVKNMFTFWFGGNMQVTTIVTGAIAISLGLNLAWSILAIVLGNVIGGIFMAYHAAQGPKLGIPQMIQSRAQFGVIGAALPLVVVIIMYIGFFATTNILGAQTLSHYSLPSSLGIVLISIVSVVISVFGYDLFHFMWKYLSIVYAVFFLIITILALRIPLPKGSLSFDHVNGGMFLLALGIYAIWQISYGPYVADYSRYLPEDTPQSQTFWYTYCGSVIASIWMMILGAFLTVVIPKFADNAAGELAKLCGPHFSGIIYILMILGILGACAGNLYGGFMAIITTLQPLTRLRGTPRTRAAITFIACIIGTAIALWSQGNFLSNFSNFLTLLMYFMIPWSAINLVDYYFVRKGSYDVEAIFDVNGQYGRVNWVAIAVYAVTVIFELPFMNVSFYVGFIAKALGGADVSWIVALLVGSVLYYVPMRRKVRASTSNTAAV